MKNTLLITTSIAALMAGVGLASAQGMNERREAPAAAASEQKAPGGQSDHQKSTPSQKSDSAKPSPTAQTPEKAKPGPTAQTPEKAKPGPTAQNPEKAKPGPAAQAPEKAKPGTTAQQPEKAPGTNRETVGQSPSQGAAPNAAVKEEGSKSGASAPLSAEQHVKIRETLREGKAERLNNVPFSISVGAAVPTTVHLYRLPVGIVEYAPQYRDYDYILVGDDILIVDPRTHKIVAVIGA
jgi:Protein of unknown function (DUF1236)